MTHHEELAEKIDDGVVEASGPTMMDRRGMLTAAAAAAAGLVGSMALPGIAAAATGDAVTAGNVADGSTTDPGLWGRNINAGGGVGVFGDSLTGDGVVGHSAAGLKSGVWGQDLHAAGTGVTGDGGWRGVLGRSENGDGVVGTSAAALKSGVYGATSNSAGFGIFGDGGTGVGVEARSTSGKALNVVGVASFSRSGTTTIPKRKSSLVISVPSGVSTTAKLLVTLQGDAGSGVYLKYAARTGATAFKVVLNKKSIKAAKVAWMVLD